MSSPRAIAIAVGLLFWISNLSTLVGGIIAGAIPSAADALKDMSPHSTQVILGTLIGHINDAAIIGYAVLLFPVLKRFGEDLALGYVAFKVVEAALLLVSAAALLSTIALSQKYLAAGAGAASSFQPSAELALAQQFWASRLATLSYVVATLILNYLLYRSVLVPRFISVWGGLAVALLVLGLLLGVGDPTRGFQAGQLLVIPIILWELFFATWLIVRGFNPAALPSGARDLESEGAQGQRSQ